MYNLDFLLYNTFRVNMTKNYPPRFVEFKGSMDSVIRGGGSASAYLPALIKVEMLQWIASKALLHLLANSIKTSLP